MSNLAKKTQLKEIFQHLWNKVKEKFITEVKYDSNDKKLKYTKNGQDTEITSVITKWGDLEHTTQSSIKNIFDKTTQVTENRYYFVNNGFYDSNDWCMATIPCGSEKQFTVVKMTGHDSGHVAFLGENMSIVGGTNFSSYTTVNGKTVYKITIPNNLANVAYFTVNMYKQRVTPDQVMVFSGHIDDNDIPTNYIPFMGGASVLVDSNEVALTFDKTGTSLTSVTVHSAIKELDKKVVNTGTVKRVNGETPNQDGNVVVNAEHINYNGNASNIIATNVQEAIDKLKEDVVLIDGAEIFIKADKTELDDFLNNPNTLKHGDLIYIINSTGVIDFNGQPANGGNPVAMIFDNNLTTGNKLRVFSKFSSNVNVSADNVSYDDQTTNLQANNVQGAIGKLNEKIANAGTVKSVNSVMPQVDGDVVLRGENINVEVLFTPGTVQTHLEDIKRLAQTAQNEAQTALLRADNAFNSYNRLNPIVNSNTNEITALKRRSQYRVGDVITTFRQSNNNYTINNVEFIYLGRANNTVSATTYPDLATAFGIQSSAANFTLPQIQDIERFFDVNRRTYQKHFIVAKIN